MDKSELQTLAPATESQIQSIKESLHDIDTQNDVEDLRDKEVKDTQENLERNSQSLVQRTTSTKVQNHNTKETHPEEPNVESDKPEDHLPDDAELGNDGEKDALTPHTGIMSMEIKLNEALAEETEDAPNCTDNEGDTNIIIDPMDAKKIWKDCEEC